MNLSRSFKPKPSSLLIDENVTPLNFAVPNENNIIICIPRSFSNITEKRIYEIFTSLKLGDITNIELLPRKNQTGDSYNKVFIHINLNTNSNTLKFKERLSQGKRITVVYDAPWFWELALCKKKETSGGSRKRKARGSRKRKARGSRKRKVSSRKN
jgi:hypothetical protein